MAKGLAGAVGGLYGAAAMSVLLRLGMHRAGLVDRMVPRRPDRRRAWKTVEGGPVAHSGRVQFRENPDRTTRIDIRMSYNPQAEAMGHAVASVLGFDPRRSMDDDLVRVKSLLEEGKTRGRAERVTRSEL